MEAQSIAPLESGPCTGYRRWPYLTGGVADLQLVAADHRELPTDFKQETNVGFEREK